MQNVRSATPPAGINLSRAKQGVDADDYREMRGQTFPQRVDRGQLPPVSNCNRLHKQMRTKKMSNHLRK